MKKIEKATIIFDDGTQAKVETLVKDLESRIFKVELSTGNIARIINKNGTSAKILETVLSRKEEEELEIIADFLK